MDASTNITGEEFLTACDLLRFVGADERLPVGRVRLSADGTRRSWVVTGQQARLAIHGGPDRGVYHLWLSPGLVEFAAQSCIGLGAELHLSAEAAPGGSHVVTLTAPGAAYVEQVLPPPDPDPELAFPGTDPAGPRAVVNAGELWAAVRPACHVREVKPDGEMAERRELVLRVGPAGVETEAWWPTFGSRFIGIHAEHLGGEGEVHVDATVLLHLVEFFEDGDELMLLLPSRPGEPLRLHSVSRSAALTPIPTPDDRLRGRVIEAIVEVCGSLAAIPDDDGDYPLWRRDVPIYGRFVPRPAGLAFQVFAVLLDQIEPTPELLRELNDHNAAIEFARLFHVDRQVLAEADLLAASLDVEQLRHTMSRIHQLATELVPLLSAYFGGHTGDDPSEVRWSALRSTLVAAELAPGSLSLLNGPDGIDRWVFPGPVHVLTAWNPEGVELDPDHTRSINAQIGRAILEFGGRFVHGAGHVPDRDGEIPSLVAWGLTRDQALSIARRAAQEAIFEIDHDEVRLLACGDDRSERWGRRDR